MVLYLLDRLFWAACCLASLWGMCHVLLATWIGFHEDAVSFVSDTAYLDWNTSLPATTICNVEDYSNRTRDYLRSRGIYAEEVDAVITIYKEIAFFFGYCEECYEDDPEGLWPPAVEFYNITLALNKKCEDLFAYCKWYGQEFDCCKLFKPLRTEFGLCYALNSVQTSETWDPSRFFIVNRNTGPGRIELAFKHAVKIHHHSSEDMPTWKSQDDVETYQIVERMELSVRIITIAETVNEPEVRELSVPQRRCKFRDELDVGVDGRRRSLYPFYSYTACEVNCRYELLKMMCNCSLHYLPQLDKNTPVCDRFGLRCINQNYVLLKALRTTPRKEDSDFTCSCLPSCTELEQHVVYSTLEPTLSGQEHSVVRVTMASLPSERLIRIVVKGKLDLVVAAGGIVGLFFGASLLSTVEIVYYLLIRPLHP